MARRPDTSEKMCIRDSLRIDHAEDRRILSGLRQRLRKVIGSKWMKLKVLVAVDQAGEHRHRRQINHRLRP